MKKKFKFHKTLLLLLATTFCIQNSYSQTTYTVTSTAIEGAGSLTEAVDFANANVGQDTIKFTPSLQVNAAGTLVNLLDPSLLYITESVIIDGQGAALIGNQFWFTQGGAVNNLTNCPGNVNSTIQSSFMPGFIAIGTPGQNNSSINVTVKNLTIEHFKQVATIY